MNPTPIIISLWYAGLFVVCTLYALYLESLHRSYDPNWTWATVVVGNALIGGALWGIEAMSVSLTFPIIVGANFAAGTPIICWQLWARARREGRL